MSLSQFKETGLAFFLGGTVLAIVLGGISFVISYFLLKQIRKSK
jgi:uncharacterized membrane protein